MFDGIAQSADVSTGSECTVTPINSTNLTVPAVWTELAKCFIQHRCFCKMINFYVSFVNLMFGRTGKFVFTK